MLMLYIYIAVLKDLYLYKLLYHASFTFTSILDNYVWIFASSSIQNIWLLSSCRQPQFIQMDQSTQILGIFTAVYHHNWTLVYLENISSSILVSGLARVSILQLMSTEERSEILTCTVKSQAQARSSHGSPVSWTEGRGWQTRILGAQTGSPNISCHEAHVSNCQFESCISNIYYLCCHNIFGKLCLLKTSGLNTWIILENA